MKATDSDPWERLLHGYCPQHHEKLETERNAPIDNAEFWSNSKVFGTIEVGYCGSCQGHHMLTRDQDGQISYDIEDGLLRSVRAREKELGW